MKVSRGGISSSYLPQEDKKASVILKTGRSAEFKFISDKKSDIANTVDEFFRELHLLSNKEIKLNELAKKLDNRKIISAKSIEDDLIDIISNIQNPKELSFLFNSLKKFEDNLSSTYQSPEEIKEIEKLKNILEEKVALISNKLGQIEEQLGNNSNLSTQRGSDTIKVDTLRIKRQLQPVTVKLGIIVLRVTISSPEKATLAKAMAWVAKPRPIATRNRIKLPNDKKGGFFSSEGRLKAVLQTAFPRDLKSPDESRSLSPTTQSSADKPLGFEANIPEVTRKTTDFMDTTTTDKTIDMTVNARSSERAAEKAKSLIMEKKEPQNLKKTEEPLNPRQPEKAILTPTERDHRPLIHSGSPPLASDQRPSQDSSAKKAEAPKKFYQLPPQNDELLLQLEELIKEIEDLNEKTVTPNENDENINPERLLKQLAALKPAIQKFIAQEKDSLEPCLSAIRIGNKLEQLKRLEKELRDLSARPRFEANVNEMLVWLNKRMDELEAAKASADLRCSQARSYHRSENIHPKFV